MPHVTGLSCYVDLCGATHIVFGQLLAHSHIAQKNYIEFLNMRLSMNDIHFVRSEPGTAPHAEIRHCCKK